MASLTLSSYSATGFGCKQDLEEVLEYFNLAATFKDQSAQLLIHRVFETHGRPPPVLKPTELPPCSESGTEESDGEDSTTSSDNDSKLVEEDVDMAESGAGSQFDRMQHEEFDQCEVNQEMASDDSATDSEESLVLDYSTFYLSSAIDMEFKQLAGADPTDWYCWNVRCFMTCLADAMKSANLYVSGKWYKGLDDNALLSDVLEECTRRIPLVQFSYEDGTRGDVSLLHHASSCGALDVVKYLIESGMDVDVNDSDGRTALYQATMSGHRDITEFLVERGANAAVPTPSGQYPLHGIWMFADSEIVEVARLLVYRAGADVNASMGALASVSDTFYGQTFEGTALHAAVIMQNQVAARVLLDLGADVNSRPFDKLDTPIEMAAKFHMASMTQLLLDRGADLLSKQPSKDWALHHVGRHVPPLRR
jgi:Ankyrin repeats (3 copies)